MNYSAHKVLTVSSEIRIFNTNGSKMGHSYAYRCTFCGFEQEFNHGQGFLIHSQPVEVYLQHRTRYFHYKTHQLIKRLSKLYRNLFIKAGFEVYKCPHCKTLTDKIEVTVFNEDQVVHKSEFRCSECRARLRRTNIHRLQKANCPKCHKKTFESTHSHRHLWD